MEMSVSFCELSIATYVLFRSIPQYPTAVAHHLYKLGQVHGHAKISYTLMSMGLPEQILKIMEGYLRYGRGFKLEGSDF